LTIEHTVVDGFVEMFDKDFVGAFEIGYGASDANDLVVGASGESHFGDAISHEVMSSAAELAVLPELSAGHLRIMSGVGVGEAVNLSIASFNHHRSHIFA
jgi:hypothetical protein